MNLHELIQELRELRDARGGDCPVKIKTETGELAPIYCKADTTSGATIIEIIAE